VPRPAATVVLLKDGRSGLEVYLLRRARSMAFAAGMYAFPGGTVDPRDAGVPPAWAGPSAAEWARRLGTASEAAARALVCAAIRETYEESGVLLAELTADAAESRHGEHVRSTGRHENPGDVGPPRMALTGTTGAGWEADRRALLSKELAFVDFLRRRALVLRTDRLALWAHWITPRFEARRYDTRFFVAALPPGQQARDVSGEADGVAWLTPAQALDRLARGEIAMLPPTAYTLLELSDYGSAAAAIAAAVHRTVRPITPHAVIDGPDVRLALPSEIGSSRPE
jgi:8-oxo-dGTP pyrophosphatase MutT (NUDIX family)